MPVPSLKRIGDTPAKEEGASPLPAAAPPLKTPVVSEIGLPLEPDAPDAPPQRGSISRERAEQLRLQLWLADKLRQSIAPDMPLVCERFRVVYTPRS